MAPKRATWYPNGAPNGAQVTPQRDQNNAKNMRIMILMFSDAFFAQKGAQWGPKEGPRGRRWRPMAPKWRPSGPQRDQNHATKKQVYQIHMFSDTF